MADRATTPPCIAVENATKLYPGGIAALGPLSLAFEAGKTTALVGPSGCGKSTLLRLIAGLEPPSGGIVTLDGQPPAALQARGGLAMAFQDHALLPWRSVAGNIALARHLARLPRDPDYVARLIDLVGLSGFAGARPAELSGGMRQRAAIARAMATRPGLLLLDEPFGAVDALTRQQLARDLPPLWHARATTTVFVTHSVDEAIWLSDRVYVLSTRPARAVLDLPIDQPHPRPPRAVEMPGFADLSARILAALEAGQAA